MWNVECVRCGEMITAESPDDIKQDVDGNPRHESCPYADEPAYPVEVTVRTSRDLAMESIIESNFPHLTPRVETSRTRDVVPPAIYSMGNESLSYRITAEPGNLWDANVDLLSVNGTPVGSAIPRLVYECEDCGTRVDGAVMYLSDGYLPFAHKSCTSRGSPKFKPVEVSSLDTTIPEGQEDDVLERYKQKYME